MFRIACAAFALTVASSLGAQAPTADLSYSAPLAGTWSYRSIPGGSEAIFSDTAQRAQLTLRCTRATRRVAIAKPASAAVASFSVWTSSASRAVATSFNPATGQLSAELQAYDPLLDAITFSRGRFGVTVAGAPPLVLPAWVEPARIIEDCRG